MAEHFVRIINKRCTPYVVPPSIIVKPGDIVKFRSYDYPDIKLLFPRTEIFEDKTSFMIPLHDFAEAEVQIRDTAVSGVYSYAVYCEGRYNTRPEFYSGDDFAEGNTPPRMIVER